MRHGSSRRFVLTAVLLAAAESPLRAASLVCGDVSVGPDVLRCDDGSIPNFSYTADPPAPGATSDRDEGAQDLLDALEQAKNPIRKPGSENVGFYGIWHTAEPGESYGHTVDVPGASEMDIPAGVRHGDLTIAPNGNYAWNRYNGLWGHWVKPRNLNWDVLLLTGDDQNWLAKLESGGRLRLQQGDHSAIYGTR